ncbi:MAG TPA: hypothetical protein VMT76_01640 [Puia sp.]|nr:hypothetical protein [Puia sp.]
MNIKIRREIITNDHLNIDGDTRAGTIGGTLVVVLLNLFCT